MYALCAAASSEISANWQVVSMSVFHNKCAPAAVRILHIFKVLATVAPPLCNFLKM